MAFDFSKITSFVNDPKKSPIFGGKSFSETKVGGFTNTVMNNVKTGNTGSYDSAGFGAVMSGLKVIPVYGQVLGLVEGIIGKGTINNTLGQIFKKGHGFQCWGATWTPSRAERVLPEEWAKIEEMAKQALNVPPDRLEASINQFYVDFYNLQPYAWDSRHWLLTSAKDCTKKGLEKYIKGLDAMRDKVTEAFRKSAEAAGLTFTMLPKKQIELTRRNQKPIMHPLENVKIGYQNNFKGVKARAENLIDGGSGQNKGSLAPVIGLAALGFFLFGLKKFK